MNYSIPYTIEKLFGGLGEARGMLTFDGRQLRLEYRTQDSVFGIVKSPIRTVLVDVASIVSLELRKGVFRSSLRLQLNSYRMATKIPTDKNGEIRLTIDKKHYPDLQALQTDIRSAITNREVDRLLAESRGYQAFDPPPPPPAR